MTTAQASSDNPAPAPVSFWRRAWRRWERIAHVIGNFQARVLLAVFYFVAVPPFAMIVKLFKDPLHYRVPRGTFWLDRPLPETASDGAMADWHRRQY
jgi:hypothetical protein